jgi:Cys-tRNA(Pro)/Cys-tRNA(Cys) deacylase
VAHKTNAVRLLDQLGIQYELKEYEFDPEELAAEIVAAKIGMSSEQVFKTLVARGDGCGICLAVVPGNSELDLKALAVASGDRKMHLLAVKQLLALTGYIRGGVTAFGGKNDYPVYVDQSIERCERISVSAGIRGMQILLAPADYLRLTQAQVLPLAQRKK